MEKQDLIDTLPDRDRLPNREKFERFIPSDETKLKVKVYGKLLVAILTLMIGATLLVSGVVLIPMMAFAYNVMNVVIASAMVAVGATLGTGSYLWLTNPT